MSQLIVSELKSEMQTQARWLIKVILNTAIFACWAIIHSLLNKYIFLQVSFAGIDEFLFRTLQMLGVISTLLPILFHTSKDIIEAYDEFRLFLDVRRNADES